LLEIERRHKMSQEHAALQQKLSLVDAKGRELEAEIEVLKKYNHKLFSHN
jgi:hypothetical protein